MAECWYAYRSEPIKRVQSSYLPLTKIKEEQKMAQEETVTLTQTPINQSINAFEEANRVLNNLNETFITPEDISNLQEEIRAAWKTISQAQHQQRRNIKWHKKEQN